MCYKNENDSVKKPLNIIDRIIISDKYNDEDKVELIDYLATQRGVDIGKSIATAAVLLSYPLLEKMLELGVDINEKFEYTHKSKTYNISGFELAIYRTTYNLYISVFKIFNSFLESNKFCRTNKCKI
jgi:hypothetical protein